MSFGIFDTVNGNYVLSRPLITLYFLILCTMTYLGKGFLGSLDVDPAIKGAAAITLLLIVMLWLYGSPKMRFYYALIIGNEVTHEQEADRARLSTTDFLGAKGRRLLSAFLDNMETIVLVGFIFAAIYAVVSTST